MGPVRWGILSTAHIGTQKVIPAMLKSSSLQVSAIASRDLATAQGVAATLGIATAHGSYEALLADPSIEVIYNPLPNHLHVPMTLAAAQAGKHVLCEKPMSMNAAELEVLRPFTSKVHIQEAFMVRSHPQWIAAREHVRRGEIGELRFMQVPFSYFNVDAANIRNRPDAGGGALYDIGCYAVAAGRWFFEGEPERVAATIDRDPAFGTDRRTSALLDFGAGRHLDFTVSTQAVPYQRVQISGTKKRLEIRIPFNAPPDASTTLLLDDGSQLDGSTIVAETVPACDHYTLQGDAFARAVRGETALPYGVADAVQNMRIIEALFRSETSGRWETP